MDRSLLCLEAICTEGFGVCVCMLLHLSLEHLGEVLEALKAPDSPHEVYVTSSPLFQVCNIFESNKTHLNTSTSKQIYLIMKNIGMLSTNSYLWMCSLGALGEVWHFPVYKTSSKLSNTMPSDNI